MINHEHESISKAFEAVTQATRDQIWYDADREPENVVADVLHSIVIVMADAEVTYRQAATKCREKADYESARYYSAKCNAYLEALDIVTDLYCRSIREYSEAKDYARSAFANC